MIGQVIPGSFLWFVCLCAVLSIGIIGCGGGEDENDWVGTWAMESVDGQSVEQSMQEDFGDEADVSIVTNSWRFNSDGTMEAEVRVKIEGGEGGTEITATSARTAMGTYSLSGSSYTLTLEITINFLGEAATETDVDTGTWSRKGNTLTLISDEGETIVFKKK